jgi:hypothetical protein
MSTIHARMRTCVPPCMRAAVHAYHHTCTHASIVHHTTTFNKKLLSDSRYYLYHKNRRQYVHAHACVARCMRSSMRASMHAGHRACVAVYLHSAVKYHKLTRRPSQEQKGLDERASLSSQRPSHPCGRPRSRPCGRTSSAWATSPCRSPRALLAHTPTGCGHGGTRKSRTSRKLQTWSVNPAAIAGVHGRHCWADPVPWVGRGCGSGWRKEA